MFSLSCFLAWRYICGALRHKTLFVVLLWSFIATATASCSLSLILAIVRGFEQATSTSLQGIHADLLMQSYSNHINFHAIKKVIEKEFPAICSLSPSDYQQGLLKSDTKTSSALTIKALDPFNVNALPALEKACKILNNASMREAINNNGIIVGYKLAELLDLRIGDTTHILMPQEENSFGNTISLSSHEALITGILKTGIEEFDASIIICSLSFLCSIQPHAGISMIHIHYKKGTDEQKLIQQLRNRFKLDVYSWKELYPALIAAQQLEKYSTIMVLCLIAFIALISIITLQYLMIIYKKKDTLILRAMGLSQHGIALIFAQISIIITFCGVFAGLCLAFICAFLLKKSHCITLPDAYYVQEFPILLDFYSFFVVGFFMMILSICAALFPIFKKTSLHTAQLLKEHY
jgi:lipoprotein-releasing system permease protein